MHAQTPWTLRKNRCTRVGSRGVPPPAWAADTDITSAAAASRAWSACSSGNSDPARAAIVCGTTVGLSSGPSLHAARIASGALAAARTAPSCSAGAGGRPAQGTSCSGRVCAGSRRGRCHRRARNTASPEHASRSRTSSSAGRTSAQPVCRARPSALRPFSRAE